MPIAFDVDARCLALLVALAACGGSDATHFEPLPTPVVLEGWPALPFSLAETSNAFRTLFSLCEELPPLHGPREGATATWIETVYQPWMDDRTQRLATATRSRRELRAQDEEQQALGAALMGLLQENTARSLEAVRGGLSPAALAELHRPAQTLRERARRAYEVCFELAVAGPHLDGWRHACENHIAGLGGH